METYSNIKNIDPSHPEEKLITITGDTIKKGGVVVFPTWCLYGLAVDPFNENAVNRIFKIKKRAPDKPILLLIKNKASLTDIVQDIPEIAKKIMDRFWPGKITLIFKARKHIPPNLTAGTGKIGVRIPITPIACAILNTLKTPITGTSANISGQDGCSDIMKLSNDIKSKSDIILDAGKLKGGIGSTIIDVTTPYPEILREGAISAKKIFNYLGK